MTETNRLALPIRERERFTRHTVDIGAFYGTVNRQEVARAHTSGARSLCRPRRTPVAPLIPLSKDSGPAGDFTSHLKFSHKFHLTTAGAKCTDCHLTAAESAAATDNLWPAEKTCLTCHDGKRARNDCAACHNAPVPSAASHESTRRPSYIIRFSHKTHAAFGDIGPLLAAAVSSGSYLDPHKPAVADLNTKNACAACHRGVARVDLATKANLPQMADCLTCHTDMDPPDSCKFCHTVASEQLKPANHTPDFLDAHSRMKLDKSGCALCHGRKFTCMGCH